MSRGGHFMHYEIKQTYLKQSYSDNWRMYKQSLEKNKEIPKWDVLIITASNENQAKAYRMQIDERLKKGYLSKETKYLVVADPGGKRIGSGGATLNALYEVVRAYGLKEENPFEGRRMLLIHSGGDSKRIPQYSAFGKLFSRVPRELPDGRYSTLFDEFIIALSGVPSRMAEGVLIASGDVLLVCNTNQMDFRKEGIVGIAIQVEKEVGTKHGVYQMDEDFKVNKFLHKLPVARLREEGAINENGLVNVDTGLIGLDAKTAHQLLDLILREGELDPKQYARFINEKLRLNLYGDFLMPFTKESSLEEYLKEPAEGEYSEALLDVRRQLWDTFKESTLYVQPLSPAKFIHFGTSKELCALMQQIYSTYGFMEWSKSVVSVDDRRGTREEISLINSEIGENVVVGKESFIEDSQLRGKVKIGKGCILSNIKTKQDFELEENLVLHTLPVKDAKGHKGYITRVYGVGDNPKESLEVGTFLGKPLKALQDKIGVAIKNLWELELYPLRESIEESIESALWLSQIRRATKEEIEKWQTLKRYSLKESYEIADLKAILENQEEIEDLIRVKTFISKVDAKEWVEDISLLLGTDEKSILRRAELALDLCEEQAISLERIRMYRYLGEVYKKNGKNFRALENKAYEDLAKLIGKSTRPIQSKRALKVERDLDKVIKVEMPARINFGGGWSDTPPYSIENGGTVLNAAILLNGKLPIQVEARFLKERIVRFKSYDLGLQKSYEQLKELKKYHDPTDPFALHKAALSVVGIIPWEEEDYALDRVLDRLGGGIELITKVDIPKGSGLGSSSILAGAVVKALKDLLGETYTPQELFEAALYTEQLMTTGGGWQDQVGGLVPGMKLISSQKGLPQQLDVVKLKLSDALKKELDERLVLVYTGQRRLAKGILREIMGDYILSHPNKVVILNEIQKLAILMKYELEKEHLDYFCELLNRHFKLIKQLDVGSTNPYIEGIIEVCKPYTQGMMICGAGGGGFLQLILKNAACKTQLVEILEEVFGDNHVEVWDAKIYEET